jgi:flagellar basal-body rod modification protein FlgD
MINAVSTLGASASLAGLASSATGAPGAAGTNPSATASTASADASGPLPSNQQISEQQFLTLFIAQLQNQDPLSPMDPTEITSQLAQFSSLEQLTQVNSNLGALKDGATDTTRATALGLLGKQVSVDGGTLQVTGGNAPSVRYSLGSSATDVAALVQDSQGTTVRTIDLGAQGAGAHTFQFDGKSSSGAAVPDGIYTLQVVETTANAAQPTAVPVSASGTVTAVDLSANPPTVEVNGQQVTLDKIQLVSQSS